MGKHTTRSCARRVHLNQYQIAPSDVINQPLTAALANRPNTRDVMTTLAGNAERGAMFW